MLSKNCIWCITAQQLHQKARKQIGLRAFLLIVLCCVSCGCSQLQTSQNLLQTVQSLSGDVAWQEISVAKTPLPVRALIKTTSSANDLLRIYIEGDGRAWINRFTPATDPTPRDPLALRLALQDPASSVAYLARPCQFIPKSERDVCLPVHWTKDRFSAEIIKTMDTAVSQLKKRSGASRMTLIGYSGGGAVATLIAARRNDVDLLVTVAGVLDHASWTELKQVSPLSGSLNPVDELGRLVGLRQVHFVGGKDNIVPPEIARSYVDQAVSSQVQMILLPDQGHHCCWEKVWLELLENSL